MTRPTREGHQIPLLAGRLGSPLPNPITDPPDPIDRAAGIDVFIPPSAASIAPVRSATGGNELGGQDTIALGGTATAGHLLVFSVATRGSDGEPATPTGYTKHPDGSCDLTGGSLLIMYYKIADGTETGVTFTPNGGGGWIGGLSEWSVGPAFDVAAEITDNLPGWIGAPVEPTAGSEALIIGTIAIGGGVTSTETATPDADWTELHDAMVPPAKNPHFWSCYQIVPSASGTYTPSGVTTTTGTGAYGAQTLAFARTANPVNGGPSATDGSDATCVRSAGEMAVAIDLGAAYRIVRMLLRIGSENAGAKTYQLEGANEADFSDAVTLESFGFTAAGAYADQEVIANWDAVGSFRYFRVTGDDESRDVCSLELYEASLADIVPEHGALDGRDAADQHPADAVSYDNATSGLAATDVQAAIDELADSPGGTSTLAELTDVDLYDLIDGDMLAYHAASGTWRAVDPPSGSVPSGTDPGDLLIWDGAAWASLPIGNDDEVLTADAGEAFGAKWAAAAGGGLPAAKAWLSGNFAAEDIPASPNATYDDEFDDTTGMSGATNGLNARWNWRNQGGATVTFTQVGYLSLNCPAQASSNWRIIEIASLADGTYEAKIGLAAIQTQVGQAGLVIVDGTNGDFYTFEIARLTNGANILVQRFTNVTTFSAALASFSIGFLPPELILRVVRSGTAMAAWASVNGHAWLRVHTWTDAIGASRIGLGVNESNNTGTSQLVADYFRKVS